jgi:hypothetical protein
LAKLSAGGGALTLNDIQRAALVLYAARQVGVDGNLEQMKAVCYILRNRQRAGWGDGNWLTVIEEAPSVAGNDPLDERLRLEDRRLQNLARDIDMIFYSQEDDEISRVCARQDKDRPPIFYWCFIHRPIRDWFARTIASDPTNHKMRAQIAFMMLYE